MRTLLRWILPARLAATASAGPINDLVAGFSNSGNPSGVFSYYHGPTADTLYSFPGQSTTLFPQSLPAWFQNGGIPDDLTITQHNSGSAGGSGTIAIPNGYLNLDPENYNVEVVFTVPSGGAGTYLISGNFYGDDSSENSHPVDINADISSVLSNPYSNTISAYQQKDSFSESETLSVGDTITFFVGTGSAGCSYCDLSTGLQGTITLQTTSGIPEPASFLLAGVGLAALIARRFTSRRPRS
jgi:hypothetical protein